MDQGFDGSLAARHAIGRFRFRKIFEVAKHDRRTLPWRQQLERTDDVRRRRRLLV